MSTPLFFPPVTYCCDLSLRMPLSLVELCQLTGVKCKATGPWTARRVELVCGQTLTAEAQPGDWGDVRITIPLRDWRQRGSFALAFLAYGLHDLVAKQSIVGTKFSLLAAPKGRPKKKRALSVKERQRKFRALRRN